MDLISSFQLTVFSLGGGLDGRSSFFNLMVWIFSVLISIFHFLAQFLCH